MVVVNVINEMHPAYNIYSTGEISPIFIIGGRLWIGTQIGLPIKVCTLPLRQKFITIGLQLVPVANSAVEQYY